MITDKQRKTLTVAEFRAWGLLQEVNRQFFHPLGFALSVEIGENGEEKLGRGYDATRTFLKENPKVADAILKDIKAQLASGEAKIESGGE